MQGKVAFPIVTLIVLVAGISSCTRCMCCGPIYGQLQCIKGTDTVKLYINPVLNGNLADSANFYQSVGYTCTSSTQVYWERDAVRICNAKDIQQEEAMGNGCVPFKDGNCNVF